MTLMTWDAICPLHRDPVSNWRSNLRTLAVHKFHAYLCKGMHFNQGAYLSKISNHPDKHKQSWKKP